MPSPFPAQPVALPARSVAVRAAGVVPAAVLLALVVPLAAPVTSGSGESPAAGAALASDLDDRQDRNRQRLQDAQADLELTSGGLQRATADLARAQGRLDAAERTLAATRAELTAAEAVDAQRQRELDAAREALREARRELRRSQAELEDRRGELGSMAASSYQTADTQLMQLSAVFNAEDLSTATVQLNTARNMLDKELTGLDRLRASEVLLTVGEEQVAEMRREVAVQRAAAAANLRRVESLEAAAAAETADVASSVEAARAARTQADEARQRDLRMLGELERERDRIGALLRARAEEARRRAAAAAAAREAAREAERARAEEQRRQEQRRQQQRSAPAPAAPPPPPAAPAAPSAPAASAGGALSAPVDGYVTSSFGYRNHPIHGGRTFHDGVDYGSGRCGVPIRAAASGQVVSRYFQSAYGNRLVVDHGLVGGAGLATIYNHASSYTVSAGQSVSRGQLIGYVGDTGWSTGCHLHFSVLRNGSPVDPYGYL